MRGHAAPIEQASLREYKRARANRGGASRRPGAATHVREHTWRRYDRERIASGEDDRVEYAIVNCFGQDRQAARSAHWSTRFGNVECLIERLIEFHVREFEYGLRSERHRIETVEYHKRNCRHGR